ncbi:MAG: hypothetical protein OEV93_03685 [Candidatus Moranbacteria bacterium]|nr:hypothetical protein [Candidatus Moranbacteria bacterium]
MRINQSSGMEPYGNVSGDSSVEAYKIGDDFIQIKFYPSTGLSRTNYLFTYESAGKENVERMKEMAKEGRGLNHFAKYSMIGKYSKKW